MTSCNYHLVNDGFESIVSKLDDINTAVSSIEVEAKIDELDIDLDNLERQITISNKLKFLELVGTNIMSEEDQLEAYSIIKEELFAPSMSSPTLEEEEGGL